MNNIEKIEIKEYTYVNNQIPYEFCGTKIAFLTDIHHGKCFSKDKLTQLIDKTNSLNPDLILLGGDYIDKNKAMIKSFFEEAKKLTAPLGVYGVLGNHDRIIDENMSENYLLKSGIVPLDNKAVFIRKGKSRIRLGGVGDFKTANQNLRPMLKGTRDTDFMLLLTHNPDYVKKLPKNRIDLVFCGHTHGGQISYKGVWSPTVVKGIDMKYLTGVVKKDNTTVIISNGIGTVGIPLRICAKPQIWLVDLENS